MLKNTELKRDTYSYKLQPNIVSQISLSSCCQILISQLKVTEETRMKIAM